VISAFGTAILLHYKRDEGISDHMMGRCLPRAEAHQSTMMEMGFVLSWQRGSTGLVLFSLLILNESRRARKIGCKLFRPRLLAVESVADCRSEQVALGCCLTDVPLIDDPTTHVPLRVGASPHQPWMYRDGRFLKHKRCSPKSGLNPGGQYTSSPVRSMSA
jgi:hypothetical protein